MSHRNWVASAGLSIVLEHKRWRTTTARSDIRCAYYVAKLSWFDINYEFVAVTIRTIWVSSRPDYKLRILYGYLRIIKLLVNYLLMNFKQNLEKFCFVQFHPLHVSYYLEVTLDHRVYICGHICMSDKDTYIYICNVNERSERYPR